MDYKLKYKSQCSKPSKKNLGKYLRYFGVSHYFSQKIQKGISIYNKNYNNRMVNQTLSKLKIEIEVKMVE